MISIIHLITTIDQEERNHLQSLIEKQISNNYTLLVVYSRGEPYCNLF